LLPLPSREDAPALLARLDVPGEDAAEILEQWPSPVTPLWRDLGESYAALVEERDYDWTARDDAPWFHAYVFLAAVDHVLALHAARGIAEDVTWATLADVGRSAVTQRRLNGRGGLAGFAPAWLTLHFRGRIYRLGRLQFELNTVWFEGSPYAKGTPSLGVHIPGDAGPLDPEACDASFAAARELFPDRRVAVCMSWLLDPQLREYLADDTNIVRFQQRFTLVPKLKEGDEDVFRFVFDRQEITLDDLPQRTTLERAIATHVRAGRHWHNRIGWLESAR